MDVKKTYYINIASGEISQSGVDSPWNYQIEATEDEIYTLRKFFDQNEAGDFPNFIRAHIPFREYHHDNVNDRQDEALKQIYQFIHQYGNEETKRQIESIGILGNN
ncbi:hydrolase [Niallia sp. Krafla_26]|uniref:hydrolase n=1 Tax=Niallia sp. Krafla_26 TaxID=3064703 RepID=UPI003D17F18F